MAEFPKREADVLALAERMISGYVVHAADFPNVDATVLSGIRDAMVAANDQQVQAKAAAVIKTATKTDVYDALVTAMKKALKQSEVDVADAPEKLEYIGWSTKAPAEPTSPPAAPSNLHSVEQGPGTLLLGWKRSNVLEGGPVRAYILQRRIADTAGAFGEWTQIATAYETACGLTGQPRGPQLEYRVIATNIRGESAPSNTLAIVL